MSHARKLSAVAVLSALAWAVASLAEAQPPIRIGATASRTGAAAAIGESFLRGAQLCVKRVNDKGGVKGGVLGRKLELVTYDDGSDAAAAVRLYEKLISQDKVDLVLAGANSFIADAVAAVTEKHGMPMVAVLATAMRSKGRKFVFSMSSPPPEAFLEGLMDLAAKKGLKSLALISRDDLAGRGATIQGTLELAKKKGLRVVSVAPYSHGADFSAILTGIRATNPDVLGVTTPSLDDAVAITRLQRVLNVNPRMVGFAPVAALPGFSEDLGRDAEFVYAAASWLPELVEVRAGGLIPIARQYPGAREFVEASKKEFPAGASPSSGAYGACQILVETVKRTGSLDGAKLRDTISKLDHNTVHGRFRVDRDGVQIGHGMLLMQWRDGRRAIVWPEELAPDKPRFPTPPWSQRP